MCTAAETDEAQRTQPALGPRDAKRSLLTQYPASGKGRASLWRGAQVEIVEAGPVCLTLSLPDFPGRVLPGRTSFLLPSAPPPPRHPRSPLFVLSIPPRSDPGPAVRDVSPPGRAGDVWVRGRGSARVTAVVCASLPVPLQGRSLARPGHSRRFPDAPEVTQGPRGHLRGALLRPPRGAPRTVPAQPLALTPSRRPVPPGGGT